jgi:hypothetical protein
MPDDAEFINRLLDEWQAGIDREENFRRLFEHYYHPVYRFFAKRGFLVEVPRTHPRYFFLHLYGSTKFSTGSAV